MAPLPPPSEFDMAWTDYRAGRFQQAAQLCGQIGRAGAGHAGALHLLGLIAARTGRDDLAVQYLDAAVRLRPDFADAHNVLGIVLVKQRKLAEAVASFRRALGAR